MGEKCLRPYLTYHECCLTSNIISLSQFSNFTSLGSSAQCGGEGPRWQRKLYRTCSLLVSDQFMTYSWLIHDLFLSFLKLLKIFTNISFHNLFTIFSGLVLAMFKTYLQLFNNLFLTCSMFMNCSCLVHSLLITQQSWISIASSYLVHDNDLFITYSCVDNDLFMT